MSDPLLHTKLFIPPPRPDLVLRLTLIERLDEAVRLGSRLILFSAPAGFGKTTLLSQWIAHRGYPTCWLTLEEGENDPVQFLRYLAAALQSLDPDIGRSVEGMLLTPQVPSAPAVLTTLINDLSALKGPFLLVLDDFHHITSSEVSRAVQFLLDHQPPQMHTLIGTRHDPPLELARLRARGQLIEIRERDLRFTLEETVEFMSRSAEFELPAADLDALHARTTGWAAGLHLASLALHESPQKAHDSITGFTGSDRYVMDYLLSEVLQNQTEEVRRFLRQTSILDRLTPPLCDALTGRGDSDRMLADLERLNLFVASLDNQRCWYAYHSLFADVLEAGLEQSEKARLHQKASEWHAAQGYLPSAVEHALAAARINQEWEHAERLIRLAVDRAASLGGVWTVRRWIEALPPERLETDGELSAYLAWSLALTGDLPSAEKAARRAEEILVGVKAPAKQLGMALAVLGFILTSTYNYPPDEALQPARRALDLLSTDQAGWRALALWSLAESLERDFQQAQAIEVFEQARQTGLVLANPVFTMLAETSLAASLNDLGRRLEAIQICEKALERHTDQNGRPQPILSPVLSRLGILYYESNQLATAAAFFEECLELSRQLDLDYYEILVRGLAAPTWFAQGETARALEALQNARHFIQRTGYSNPGWFLDWEAILRLRQATDLEETLRWFESVDLPVSDLPDGARLETRLTFCRLLLTKGKLEEARLLLDRALEFIRERGLRRWEISALILQSIVQERLGERAESRQCLWTAVQLAASQNYARLFLDEDELALALLPGVRQAAPAFVDDLLSTAGLAQARAEAHAQPLSEPLSERELEVLGLMAEGYTNREICQKLYIAEGTVKRHINHIFAKLDASSRTQAIARARKVGLV